MTNTDDINEEIISAFDWDVAISEWEELLIDEEFEEEQDDLDITHPAENQAAKWKLHDLFLPNLPFHLNNMYGTYDTYMRYCEKKRLYKGKK
ncbi:35929_t:CDS:2 [Gigaspora margarita]|uniref:35929_t:CDS:1 n=1 Tax=Gigaspora margarita TaxID=4874 RepID=A0ABN7UXL6_GIGMA|nr:35929_t:CDS:2 [Gigaspora margarita]